MTRRSLFWPGSQAWLLSLVLVSGTGHAQPVEGNGRGLFGTVVNINPYPITLDVEAASQPVISESTEGKSADADIASGPTPPLATDQTNRGCGLHGNSAGACGSAWRRLRASSSITGRSALLYVIDGMVVANIVGASSINALILDNHVDQIAGLDPNDVETLEVLKGASAAALYGSKASNGVVIITTKHGRTGETHAVVTQRVGLSQVSNMLGSRTFATIDDVKAAYCRLNEITQLTPDCDTIPIFQDYMQANGKTYNHEAEILRTPFAMETVVTVAKDNDHANYYGSALYRDEPGIVVGTFSQKQSGQLAVSYKFAGRARLGVTAALTHSLADHGFTSNDITAPSLYSTLAHTPNFVNIQPKDSGNPVHLAIDSIGETPVNLLQNREEMWRRIGSSTLTLDAYASTDGTSTVKLLGNLGADSFTQEKNIVSTHNGPLGGDVAGVAIPNDVSKTNFYWNVGAGALWTFYPPSAKFRSALSTGFTYESVDFHSVGSNDANTLLPKSGFASSVMNAEDRRQNKDIGVYLQEEITVLDERLSVVAGLLGKRSSLLGNPSEYYLHPKLAGVYSLVLTGSGEGTRDMFDSILLRAAYGEARNQLPNGAATDPTIEPERHREVELGIDLATKNRRAVAELTGYQRDTANLFLKLALATSQGFGLRYVTGGGLRNRGIEAAVQIRPVSNKVVEWTSHGMLTINRTEVTSLPGDYPPPEISVPVSYGPGAYRIEKGKSATQIVASVDDMHTVKTVGDGEPSFRVGWSNVVSAGDFTFAAQIDWQHGSDVVNATRRWYDYYRNSPDVEAAARRLEAFSHGDARPYVEDASFVKLREVAMSYTLPRRFTAQLGPVKRLELSLSGHNLLTFTSFSGLDPETSNSVNQLIGRNYEVASSLPSRSYWLSVTVGI